MLSIGARTAYLLHLQHPKKIPAAQAQIISRLYIDGTAIFLLGFLIWNLDNVFCETVTSWKLGVKWPTAFLLEGIQSRVFLLNQRSSVLHL